MENKAKEESSEQGQSTKVRKKVDVGHIFKTTWKVIEKILVIALIFVSLVIVIQRLSNNEKAFLGFRIFRVETGSMIPVYNIGDVILVREKQIDKIKVGDDVTYTGTAGTMKGKLVTHRVVEIEEKEGQKTFHTQGVANKTEDQLVVYANQINGVVLGKLYILSLITTGLTNQYVLYFCGIIPLTIFIFFAFVKGSNRKRYEG